MLGRRSTSSSASITPRISGPSESRPCSCAARRPADPPISMSFNRNEGCGRMVAEISPRIFTGAPASALARLSKVVRHAFQSTNAGAASAAAMAAIRIRASPRSVCCTRPSSRPPESPTQDRTPWARGQALSSSVITGPPQPASRRRAVSLRRDPVIPTNPAEPCQPKRDRIGTRACPSSAGIMPQVG